MKNPVVTIEMMNGDTIKAELYPEIAPNTVNNFMDARMALVWEAQDTASRVSSYRMVSQTA